MSNFVPPVCLVMALLSLIAGFAVVMVGPPDVGLELHRARVGSDEEYRLLLEGDMRRQRRQRQYLIAALVTSGLVFCAVAFLAMRPSKP
jgi:hypothetical protein